MSADLCPIWKRRADIQGSAARSGQSTPDPETSGRRPGIYCKVPILVEGLRSLANRERLLRAIENVSQGRDLEILDPGDLPWRR